VTGRSCCAPLLKTSRLGSIATRRPHLTLGWKDGALNDVDLALPRSRPATVRTDEDRIARLRRLASHYPDSLIAGTISVFAPLPIATTHAQYVFFVRSMFSVQKRTNNRPELILTRRGSCIERTSRVADVVVWGGGTHNACFGDP